MPDNDSNHTEEAVQWLPGLQTTACVFYGIIFLTGVIGNILVMIIVTRYRDMRNATNLLLTNLSVADLCLLVFCTPDGYQHLYGKDGHYLGSFMCRFSPFVQNATSTCSMLTIMAISYERYVAICQPLKTPALLLTIYRTLPTVVFFWLISCLTSIPFLVYSNTDIKQSIYGTEIVICSTAFPQSWATLYLISCTLCLYFFVFVMLCYWHFSICCALFSREALLRDNSISTRYRRQVAQLLVVLIMTFFVLILPHKILAFVQQRSDTEVFMQMGFHRHSLILIITRSLLYLNSAINPLLYSIMSTKFRQSLILLCDECRRTTKVPISDPLYYAKDYRVNRMMGPHGGVAGRSMSTTGKVSYHQFHFGQLHEKKSLLTDRTPTPVTENPIDEARIISLEGFT